MITQSTLAHPLPGTDAAWWYRERLQVSSYRLDVRLTPTGSADLDFSASATLSIKAAQAVGPWLRFALDPKLQVDSAAWGDGTTAAAFKAKEDGDLWVRAPRRLGADDSLSLTLFYHGNLIDRYANWFYIDPTAAWYPINGQGPNLATFDITYHSPSWYPLASVGDRTDSTVSGKVLSTGWRAFRRRSPPSIWVCSRPTMSSKAARLRWTCSSRKTPTGNWPASSHGRG